MNRSTSVFVTGLALFGCASAWGFRGGPPAGRTGAPLDRPGQACTVCHGPVGVNQINSFGGSIRIAFPHGMAYTPGETMDLVITATDNSAAIFGFQMTARLDRDPGHAQAGSLTAAAGQRVICSDNNLAPAAGCTVGNGIQWIEHSQPSATGVWTVRWTAPPAGSGNVHFYIAANGANGSGNNQGDHIYTNDYVLVPASSATSGNPTIRSITSAAGGANAIQSGSWMTIRGTNFAAARADWNDAITDNVFPTTLGGVTVSVNGKPAPISFVNADQINALVPLDNSVGQVAVVVSNAVGSSASTSVMMADEVPGFFTFDDRHIAAAVLDSSGSATLLAPAGSISGATSRAARAGENILLFGSGFGRTQIVLNPTMAQSVAYPLALMGGDRTAPIAILTIGGQTARITFIGLVSPGLYQINAVVPNVPAGEQPVVLQLSGGAATSTQTVTIPVQ